MVGPRDPKPPAMQSYRSNLGPSGATRRTAVGLILGAPLLAACAGVQQSLNRFPTRFSSQPVARSRRTGCSSRTRLATDRSRWD